METQIYLAKKLDILNVDKRNRNVFKTFNNFNKFPSIKSNSEINYTFVKKIQWQTF